MVMAVGMCFVTACSKTQSTETKKNEQQNEELKSNMIEIQFTIDAAAADEAISDSFSMKLPEGATVYESLEESGIHFTGKPYVQEIGNVWEGDYGEQSGWTYYVNDEMTMEDCTKYELKNGDSVKWVYVTDFSKL